MKPHSSLDGRNADSASPRRRPLMLMLGSGALAALASTFLIAQGPLTPPGAPAPTMKTLNQLEPRTPISELPFTISLPGSYYLTSNLAGVAGQHGITLAASGITLDLMGFELVGVPGSLNGVNVVPVVGVARQTNIAIRNGTVRDWGGNGVDARLTDNGQCQDLRLFANMGTGLKCGFNSGVVNCSAQGNASDGIATDGRCTISGCTASRNSGDGINASAGCTVSGCTAAINGGDGIDGGFGCTVCGCTATDNGGDGINVVDGCTVSGCTAASNRGDGIEASDGCRIAENTCWGNGLTSGAGIQVSGRRNRIDSNTVTNNDRGITILLTGNLVIRNSAGDNTPNYDIAAGNKVGPIVVAPVSAGISGDTGGAGVGSTDPWANFTH